MKTASDLTQIRVWVGVLAGKWVKRGCCQRTRRHDCTFIYRSKERRQALPELDNIISHLQCL